MNGTNWTEHTNREGRTYWFNTASKESVWEKPDDLRTPFERALSQTQWKEYFSNGKKYYYNTETKESKWDMPEEISNLQKQMEDKLTPVLATPQFTPNTNALAITDPGTPSSSSTAVGFHTGGQPQSLQTPNLQLPGALPRPYGLPEDPVIPHNGFHTHEEAEKAFMHLLRKASITATATWDQTMRAIVTDPLYKALNSLAEKKAAWQKYVENLRKKEEEDREARLTKHRPALRNILKGNPSVFHYTTFNTADKLFSSHPIWAQCKVEAERELIFNEFVGELKQAEVAESRAARSRGINKIVAMFKELDVNAVTKWRRARDMLMDSDEFHDDDDMRKLPTLDILLAFEDYSRVKEREFEEQMRKESVEKTRKERKARESYRELLAELKDSGKIVARTKWKTIYPIIEKDQRYLNILGNPGSNPLELFWDVVDGLDQTLDAKIEVVDGWIKEHNDSLPNEEAFVVGPTTTEEEFQKVIQGKESDLTTDDLAEIFKTLHDAALKKQADEVRRAERRARHLQDDLRYAIRKLPEPINVDITYEDAVVLIQDLPEYKAITDEEGRRSAFAKYIKRQKEKMREASEDDGSASGRRRKEPARDNERDKGRDYDRSSKYHRDDHERRSSYRDYDKERDSRSSKRERKHDDRRDEDDRHDKRARFDKSDNREETPEEGEI